MMTVLICLVAVCLIVCSKVLKDQKETQNLIVSILGGVLLLLIVARFATCAGSGTPPEELTGNRHWAVGWRLGSLVAEHLPDGGTVAVLQTKPTSEPMRKLGESQLAGVRSALSDERYQIVVQQPDEVRSLMNSEATSEEEKTSLKDSVMASKDAQAIVSFVQLPVSPRMKDKFPPVYLLDSFATGHWVPAMKAGVVLGAVTTHRDTSKIRFNMEGGTPQERFDAIFQLFTPENVETFTK